MEPEQRAAGPRRIVAEVNRGFYGQSSCTTTISERFARVVAVHRDRGYELESWQYQATALPDPDGEARIIETIVAVFIERRVDEPKEAAKA